MNMTAKNIIRRLYIQLRMPELRRVAYATKLSFLLKNITFSSHYPLLVRLNRIS